MFRKISAFVLIALFSISAYSQAKDRQKNKGYHIGDVAADFNLKNVDGTMYSLSSDQDVKGYIIIFTSNVCPYALGYEDRIVDLHNKMAPKGYPVIAINPNDPTVEVGDSYDEMVVNHKEKESPFVYLKDGKESIYQQFGATKTPHVFILDDERVVKYIGAIDDNARDANSVTTRYVEDAIANLESGKNPEPAITKAIGCGIKAKKGGERGKRKKRGRRSGKKPQKVMDRMDANEDGEISKEEARGPLSEYFESIDTDKNGKLSLAELSAMKEKRKKGSE